MVASNIKLRMIVILSRIGCGAEAAKRAGVDLPEIISRHFCGVAKAAG
jgi:hypothetical protein